MNDQKIAGIILAAGLGKRMGRAKQLIPFRGKPLLQWVLDAANRSDLAHVIVVLGYRRSEIASRIDFGRAAAVDNPDFRAGQSASLQVGLKALPNDCEAAVFLLADQPLVTASIINKLITAYGRDGSSIVVPACRGRRGNPVLMARSHFDELMTLTGDVGGRNLIRKYADRVREIEVADSGILTDIDTAADLTTLINPPPLQ